MAAILKTLADPQLVANIQRFCGVHPAPGFRKPEESESSRNAHGDHVDNHNGNSTTHKRYIKSNECNENITDIRERQAHENGFKCDQYINGISKQEPKETNKMNGHSSTPSQIPNGKPVGVLLDQDGVTPSDFVYINDRFLYTVFSLGAELGNESFYIIFYPYFFWNIDAWMARRVCWFWCLFMYIGQAAKDIIKWPRPASPPVFRLEKKYAFEYGMPSTHAMVGVGLPFLIFILSVERYEFNRFVGLIGTFWWCAVVCFSRLYLGMHSVLDVLAGIVLSSLLLPIWLWSMDTLDAYLITQPTAPLVAILVPLAMCLSYPRLEQWSTARGDTTLVIGVGAGVALAMWINNHFGLMTHQVDLPPYQIPPVTMTLVGEHVVRILMGGLLALLTRAIFKSITFRASCSYFRLDPKDPLTKRELVVELPVKFITYVAISLVVVVVSPILFKWLDIGRPSFYSEL